MHIPSDLSAYQAGADLLAGKNLLVTGASTGIGRAAALAFAAHGATVILLGRTEGKLTEVYDAIDAAGYPKAAIAPFDLASNDEAAYAALATQLQDHFGSLHGLLHNAGMLGPLKPLSQYAANDFQQVLDINLRSNFLLTRALMPMLEAAGHASVVFTSSSVGRKGRAYWGAYAISKFGVEGMMQVWADELCNTSDVRVNSLNPGATRTAMRRSAYPAEAADANPEPRQIMGAYLYLMGDDSIGVNGQALNARPL
ncbi:MAG: YciK family oxidoreductase [Gammaproteobacteria bacterium]|nr:YciK family oxidoreductase [Gammaproteobacteria bacterium]